MSTALRAWRCPVLAIPQNRTPSRPRPISSHPRSPRLRARFARRGRRSRRATVQKARHIPQSCPPPLKSQHPCRPAIIPSTVCGLRDRVFCFGEGRRRPRLCLPRAGHHRLPRRYRPPRQLRPHPHALCSSRKPHNMSHSRLHSQCLRHSQRSFRLRRGRPRPTHLSPRRTSQLFHSQLSCLVHFLLPCLSMLPMRLVLPSTSLRHSAPPTRGNPPLP
mmetsp:Transcript_16868/g.54949  ORF Transcript_16868/g.54949 Transcript_16868/m.54949 type:complete len:218 (-) Transcript_16868:1760-2413(-)